MKLTRVIIIGLILIVLAMYSYADPGKFCLVSTCSCGAACQDGGNEISNGYNTMDNCQDGIQDTYEYVHDITITSLNDTVFRTIDNVQVDAYVDCDLNGDEITFAYHNGTGWKPFYNAVCSISGKRHYYQNITLSNVTGNHTIRVTLAYDGASNMTCGYNYDSLYSDTDDVGFHVYLQDHDLIEPQLELLSPPFGESFDPAENLVINITVNATDETLVNVTANISWGSQHELLQMINIGNDIYRANFTNTTDIAWYDIEVIALDLWNNINKTYSNFLVNITLNVTITYPEDDGLYPSTLGNVEFEITSNVEPSLAWIELSGFDQYYNASNQYIGNKESSGEFTNDTLANVTQEFHFTKDTYAEKLSLRLAKFGLGEAQVRIMNSTAVMAYADLSGDEEYAWVNFTLNQTVFFAANRTYDLFIWLNVNPGDYFSFELANNTYPGNSSLINDLMFMVYDKYRFNVTFPVDNNDYSYIAHANTNLGHLRSSIVTGYYDFDAPVFNSFSYTPNTEFSLDPYTNITFTANVTDNLETRSVVLYFKKANESSYENITMQFVSSDIYEANISYSQELNFSAYADATDTSGYDSVTGEEEIELTYDTNWTLLPQSFNVSGILINRNTTIGNLTITSYSDFSLSFNITVDSAREVLLNGSGNISLILEPNLQAKYFVLAEAASTPQENPVSITVSANDSVVKQRNFTLISYLSGAYLFLDIVEYTSTAEPGDNIPVMRAKVWNVGNETANNILVRWGLPTDWEARGELNATFINLSSGALEYEEITVSADIPLGASTGNKTITVYANSTENSTASDSRIVEIEAQISGSSSGSGSGSGETSSSGIIFGVDDINFMLKDKMIPRGVSFNTTIFLSNNISRRSYRNIDLEIEGFFESYYSTDENFNLLYGDELTLPIVFDIPDYAPEGEKEIIFIFTANGTTIKKQEKITIFDPKLSQQECILSGMEMVREMLDYGIIGYLDEAEVFNYLNSTDYLVSKKYCTQILEDYSSFQKITGEIEELENKAKNMQDEGYNATSVYSFIKLAKDAFLNGDFAKADELLNRASLFTENAAIMNKPLALKLRDFVKQNLQLIMMMLIFVPIFAFFTGRIVHVTKKESRIKRLEKEKRDILSLVLQMQDEYYVQKMIDKRLYHEFMQGYKKRLGKIEVNLAKLSLAKEMQQQKILELLKKAQSDYYEKSMIDNESFVILEKYYKSILSKYESGSENKKEIVNQQKKPKEKNLHQHRLENPGHAFRLHGSGTLHSIKDLYTSLESMEDETFSHHVNESKNDFSKWINDVFHENELAEKTKDVRTKESLKKILEEHYEIS